MWVGILGLCGVAFVLFLITFLVLKKTTESDTTEDSIATRVMGLISIVISWLQILSALTVTYNIGWPSHFALYSKGTGSLVNLDLFFFLSIGSCQLAVPFINKFLLQILTPPLFTLSVFAAWAVLKIVEVKKKTRPNIQKARNEQAQSIVIIVIQLIYPKLATATFRMFRCVDFGPGIGSLLDADFGKPCFTGVHATYIPFAFMSVVGYLVGIPFFTFVVLYANRKKLHLPHVESRYGDLYRQYEDNWYWWECCLMVQKCLLTGAMCAIAPGSPVQLLVALFICIAYLLLILYAGPYRGNLEDTLAFLTSLCLTFSLLFGLTIIMDNSKDPTFDLHKLGIVLIVINVLPFGYFLFASVKVIKYGATIGLWKHTDPDETLPKRNTKVVPLGRRLSIQQHVKNIVVQSNVEQIEQNHRKHREAHVEKIKQREQLADSRVRMRLADRRAKNEKRRMEQHNEAGKGAVTTPSDVKQRKTPIQNNEKDYVKKVKELRLLLASKLQNEQMLVKVFQKLDKNNNGTLSPQEFNVLIAKITKKPAEPGLSSAMWKAAQTMRKGSHAIPNEEISLDTLRFFLIGQKEHC